MLRITLEIVPFGDESRAKLIGMGIIANDGSGTIESGNYKVAFRLHELAVAHGEIKDHPRLDENVWQLVLKALKSVKLEELNDD